MSLNLFLRDNVNLIQWSTVSYDVFYVYANAWERLRLRYRPPSGNDIMKSTSALRVPSSLVE